MYSKKAGLLIYLILGVSSYLGASPIRFNILAKRFYSTKWTRFFIRITTVVCTVQLLFSTYCLYKSPPLTKHSTPDEVFTFNSVYIAAMCLILPVICFLLLSFRGDAIARSLTQTLRYSKDIESKWCSFTTLEEFRGYPTQFILETLLRFFILLGVATSFVTSTAVVLHQIFPNNWISLVPKKYWNSPMLWANYISEAYLMTICPVGVVTTCSVITFPLGKKTYKAVDVWAPK